MKSGRATARPASELAMMVALADPYPGRQESTLTSKLWKYCWSSRQRACWSHLWPQWSTYRPSTQPCY